MPSLEERVAALEAKVDAHAMSTSDVRSVLTGLQDQMNRRFEHVNQRFDSLDQTIDRHFTRLVGIQVAVLVAVVGALVGS